MKDPRDTLIEAQREMISWWWAYGKSALERAPDEALDLRIDIQEKIQAAEKAIKEKKLEPDYKTILLQFLASLTLCDHMGDVSNDVVDVLEKIGVEIEWDEWDELGNALGKMGITTLNGAALTQDENEDETP